MNWADNAWCQMHLLISRLLILWQCFGIINPFLFSSELATPAPTISTTKQRPSVIFVSNATDSNTGFNASYSFIESRGKFCQGKFCFLITHLKERIKLARLNAVNWTDNIWCKMQQVNN